MEKWRGGEVEKWRGREGLLVGGLHAFSAYTYYFLHFIHLVWARKREAPAATIVSSSLIHTAEVCTYHCCT